MVEGAMRNLKGTKRLDKASGVTSVAEEVMAIGADGNFYDEVTGSWLDPELVK